MDAVNVSGLKNNPSEALRLAQKGVVVVMNRNSPDALMVGVDALGVLEESGSYESGAKHGKWKLDSDEGLLPHEYIYRYGKLRKVDGIKVDKRRDGKLSS